VVAAETAHAITVVKQAIFQGIVLKVVVVVEAAVDMEVTGLAITVASPATYLVIVQMADQVAMVVAVAEAVTATTAVSQGIFLATALRDGAVDMVEAVDLEVVAVVERATAVASKVILPGTALKVEVEVAVEDTVVAAAIATTVVSQAIFLVTVLRVVAVVAAAATVVVVVVVVVGAATNADSLGTLLANALQNLEQIMGRSVLKCRKF